MTAPVCAMDGHRAEPPMPLEALGKGPNCCQIFGITLVPAQGQEGNQANQLHAILGVPTGR